jgi:hypothetical protein
MADSDSDDRDSHPIPDFLAEFKTGYRGRGQASRSILSSLKALGMGALAIFIKKS